MEFHFLNFLRPSDLMTVGIFRSRKSIVWSHIFNDQDAHLAVLAGVEQHLECCPQNSVTAQPAPAPTLTHMILLAGAAFNDWPTLSPVTPTPPQHIRTPASHCSIIVTLILTLLAQQILTLSYPILRAESNTAQNWILHFLRKSWHI